MTWLAWQRAPYKAPHVVVACFRHPRNAAKSFVASEAEDSRLSYEAALECWRKYNAIVSAMTSEIVLINFDEPLEPQIRYACLRIGLDFTRESMSVYNRSWFITIIGMSVAARRRRTALPPPGGAMAKPAGGDHPGAPGSARVVRRVIRVLRVPGAPWSLRACLPERST